MGQKVVITKPYQHTMSTTSRKSYAPVISTDHGDAARIAQTIVDPHDHKPLRMPTFPNVERTSILPFMATTNVVVPQSNSQIGFVCRSPVAPVWIASNFTGTYLQFSYALGASSVAVPTAVGESLDLSSMMTGQMDVMSVGWAGYYGVGIDEFGNTWYYAHNGGIPYVVLTTTAVISSGTWTLDFEYCTAASTSAALRSAVTGAFSSSYIEFPLNKSGAWWRPLGVSCKNGVTPTALNITSVVCGQRGGGTYVAPTPTSFVGMQPLFITPPEFVNAPIIYSGCRVTATSVLFQNTTAVLNKEGTVECFLGTNSATNPMPVFDPSAMAAAFTNYQSDVAPSVRYLGLLEKGMYTFTIPDGLSTTFRDCAIKTTGAYSCVPVFHLDSFDYINMFRFTDYSLGDTVLSVSLDSHHEWRNTNMLWPVGYSVVPLEEFHRSQIVLASLPPFYENFTHLTAIASLARAAAMRLAPIVLPIARVALSAARDKVISMASTSISKHMGNTQIPLRTQSDPQHKKKKKANKVVVRTGKRKK